MPNDEQAPDDERGGRSVKPFAQWLQEQRSGELHDELSDALSEVVAACVAQDKPGQVSLIVKVSPNKDGLTVMVIDDVKVKTPEAPRPGAMYFTDEHGNLSRRNPSQPELPLREIGGGRATPRDIKENHA